MTHHHYMSLALQLAERGRSTVSPNPMVGCVIVKNNKVIGQGFHQRAGEHHAEIFALKEAGIDARDAIAYVSLEPCCHHGRTPPCTEALIQSGLKKIVVACLDPNPRVAGKGIAMLREAGIEVEVGLCEQEAKKLNEIFFHYIRYRRPFVIAKWAMSLDGKTITHAMDSRSISNESSQIFSHQIREHVDAILIGSKTAIQDDPLLTVRFKQSPAKHPIRIILTNQNTLPLNLKIFSSDMPAKTMVATTVITDQTWQQALMKKNVEILTIEKNNSGEMNLLSLLNELGKKEITSLLVEGGNHTHQHFFRENLINRVHVYLAPMIISDLEKKKNLKNMTMTQMSGDYFFTADDGGADYV